MKGYRFHSGGRRKPMKLFAVTTQVKHAIVLFSKRAIYFILSGENYPNKSGSILSEIELYIVDRYRCGV